MKSSSRQRRVRPLKAKAATADDAAEFDNYGAEPNMKLSHAFMVVLALHIIAVGGLFAFNKVKAGHSKVSQKLQNEVSAGQEAVAQEEAKPIVPAAMSAVAQEVKKEMPLQSLRHPNEAANPASAVTPPITTSSVKNNEGISASTKKVATPSTDSALTATQKAFLATKTSPSTMAAAPSAASSAAVSAVASMATSTATTVETMPPAPQAAPMESVTATEYTIVKGDNPYKIAKRFHVPYSELIKFNNITDPRKIQIGQKIRIPKKTKSNT